MQSSLNGKYRTPSRLSRVRGSTDDYEPLQLEYNFEEHFRHLPPTLYNRYLKSHRFLTKGKRLAPSPLTRLNRWLPTSYSTKITTAFPSSSSSLSSSPPPPSTSSSSPSCTSTFHQKPTVRPRPCTSPLATASNRYAESTIDAGHTTRPVAARTSSVSRPVSPNLSVGVATNRAKAISFESESAVKLKEKTKEMNENNKSSSEVEVKNNENNNNKSNNELSEDQKELIRTLGECMQAVYSHLQQLADESESIRPMPQLKDQVQHLQLITQKLTEGPKKEEQPSAGLIDQNRKIRQLSRKSTSSKDSKDSSIEMNDSKQAKEEQIERIDDKSKEQEKQVMQKEEEKKIEVPPTSGQIKEEEEEEEREEEKEIQSNLNRTKTKSSFSNRRRSRNRRNKAKQSKASNLIEASHLVDLLVYNQLVDQLQHFYGYTSNEQLNVINSNGFDPLHSNQELQTMANQGKCMLNELKCKLTAKLNIIHYKIYQKVYRKMSSKAGNESNESNLEDQMTNLKVKRSRQFVTRRLNKRVKSQSKYTLLMELMDDTSFQQFLMDKVKYFLHKIRCERLRKLACKQQQQKTSIIEEDLDENNNNESLLLNKVNSIAKEDCSDFFAAYKCEDKRLSRSTSESTMDSGFSSMPTSPFACSFNNYSFNFESNSNLNEQATRTSSKQPEEKKDNHFRFYCAMFTAVIVVLALTSLHSNTSGQLDHRPLPSTLNARRPSHMSCADWILLEADTLFNWPN